MRANILGLGFAIAVTLAFVGCNDQFCDIANCTTATGAAGATGSTAESSTASTSTGNSSTSTGLPCGGCDAPTPFCDEAKNMCVACLVDGDCQSATASHCDGGSCVACGDSSQCQHLAGTTACDAGTCVECMLGDETACAGGATCDLLAKTCTGAAAGTVQNCEACTNDAQCVAAHRCIAMDFQASAYGYYCLKEAMPTCDQPFLVPINKPSISGASTDTYCGIEEDNATCEAVLALINNWRCSGTDGMCSPDGVAPEVPTPGALCRQVGLGANRCTYECATAGECTSAGPGATCGGTPTPTWCGG